MTDLNTQIEVLASKASDANDGAEAQRFSQAACNLANAQRAVTDNQAAISTLLLTQR